MEEKGRNGAIETGEEERRGRGGGEEEAGEVGKGRGGRGGGRRKQNLKRRLPYLRKHDAKAPGPCLKEIPSA